MTGKKSFITILLLTLMLAFVSSADVSATITAEQTVATAAVADYTLFFNCTNGKLYTDAAMTKAYTGQPGKWSPYQINSDYYALQLNGFEFTTSQPNALVIMEDNQIILTEGTTNTLKSTYKGKEICSALWGLERLSIRSTGTGSGTLIAQGGTSTGGQYSDGIYIENSLTIISGRVFTYGGQDIHSAGIDVEELSIYSGELLAKGNECSICFHEVSESGFLQISSTYLAFGGRSAETAAPLSLNDGWNDRDLFYDSPYLHIFFALSDIPFHTWYYQNVTDLYKSGLIKGYANSDGFSYQIRPQAPITRAEFVTILARIFSDEESLHQYAGQYTFADVPNWASKYIGWAANSGLVEGYNENCFGAEDNISRQDIVTILYRIVNKKELTPREQTYKINFTDENQIADYAKEAVTAMQRAFIIKGYEEGGSYRFKPQNAATRAETITMIHSFIKIYNLGATW